VNHLGHFLLTNLLLTRLIAKMPARIVIVSSGVHDPKRKTGMPKPAVTDMQTLITTGGPRKGEFEGRLAYVNSKLCNLWFAYELVRRIKTVYALKEEQQLTVNGFDPGLVPGSGLVKLQAEAEGLDRIIKAAGFDWREPGCSMCLGMNPDQLKPGQRCASTSNRNFEGRQGYKGRTHLVSPAMAAAAAIAGHFVDVRSVG